MGRNQNNVSLFQVNETETNRLTNTNTNKKGILDSIKNIAKSYINKEDKDNEKNQPMNLKGKANAKIKTLPDKAKYTEGWIKYFTYDENGKFKPKRFFLNEHYDRESRMEDVKNFLNQMSTAHSESLMNNP